MARDTSLLQALAILMICAAPAPGQDDSRFALTPVIGVYFPAGDLVSDQVVPGSVGDEPDRIVSMSHRTGWTVGLRGQGEVSDRWSLEIEFLFTRSEIEAAAFVSPDAFPRTSLQARVFTMSVTALYELFTAPFTPLSIHLAGGLGLINRDGEFFDEGAGLFTQSLEDGTDATFILGGGIRYGLSSRLSLRLDLRDYISSYRQELPGGDLDSELQNDISVTAGLEIGM